MNIPILSAIFQGIPESTALVFLTLVFLRAKLNWSSILFLGVLQTAAAFLIRMLPLAFGVHTVILILILASLIAYVSKREIIKVIPAAIVSFVMLLLFEFAIFKTLMSMFDISFDMLIKNKLLKIAIATPQWVLLFLTGFIIQYFRGKNKSF
ncbi:MAG: hypothetical protein KGZ94_08855 [Clostridia bacterium]|nr:hypothetical protein [Clostridia bacterium]